MSLILDALRKAETERRLGEVPRLDAQPAPAPVAHRRTGSTRLRWIWIGSLTALAILASVIGWKSMRPLAPRSTPEARMPTLPPSSIVPPVSPPASQAPDPVHARSVAGKPTAVDSSVPDALPAQMRAELPPLLISGSIHSPHASERIVIINGLVLREQGEVVPGLRLEEIRSASVVFSYKGYRFEQPL